MKIQENRPITKNIETTVGYQCDACKLEVQQHEFPSSWTEVESHHEDWGNDSHESHEEHHVCSVACYLVIIKNLAYELDHHLGAVIDGKELSFIKDLLKHIQESKT